MNDAGPPPWDQAARALESTWNHASTSFSHLQRGAADAIHGGMRRVAVSSRQHAQTLRAQLLARWAVYTNCGSLHGLLLRDVLNRMPVRVLPSIMSL